MTTSIAKLIFLPTAISAVLVIGAAGSSFAGTPWQNSHPRRVEVNHRLSNQNARINQDRRDGELSRGQANQFHREDGQIRTEERDMASMDGGHLTRADQRALNQQENHVNHQITQDASRFNSTHPWRAEVNDRLANQDRRINQDVRDGDITHSQARQLHRDDNQVAQEERDMASQDGSHLTRADFVSLNQQENAVNRQIRQDQ